jgi:hypothetical protein
MCLNIATKMQWMFLVLFLAFTLVSTTDLSASGINATEIAECMVEKSPYAGSFDRWDYADYCSGTDWWDLTDTERMEIQCKIDEITGMNYGMDADADASCKCSTPDYYGGGFDDLLEHSC